MGIRKPKYVYHGSPRAVKEDFIPRVPQDLGKRKDNIVKGVYASSIKNKAIGMAISGSKGVISSGMGFGIGNQRKGIIYEGWPNQKYVYLYTFNSETFERRPKTSTQFISRGSVTPAKVEKLSVRDYIHLVRKASRKELNDFNKKYGE